MNKIECELEVLRLEAQLATKKTTLVSIQCDEVLSTVMSLAAKGLKSDPTQMHKILEEIVALVTSHRKVNSSLVTKAQEDFTHTTTADKNKKQKKRASLNEENGKSILKLRHEPTADSMLTR
jgi:hypothetical protein